jgi:cytochrome c554/c'-like protein
VKAIRIVAAVILVGGLGILLLSLGGEEKVASGESEPFTSPEQCAACHSEIAKEANESWHGQAFTDPDVLQLSKNFQDEQCVSCHAPTPIFQVGVGERVFARRERRHTGVDCLSCHLREDGTVAGTRGLTSAPCRPVAEPSLSKAVFCAGCHNQHWTVDEFMAFKAATGRPETCNSCHMERVDRPIADGGPVREGVATHRFDGGHSLKLLQEGLLLEGEADSGVLRLKVTNQGAGHKIPTDSRHKSVNLLVTLRDSAGNLLSAEQEVAEYRLYYRVQQIEPTQLLPGETREHEVELPKDRDGTAFVELVYCQKPPQKISMDWTVVRSISGDFTR